MQSKTRQQKTFSQYRKSSLPLGDVLSFQKESYKLFLEKGLPALFDEFFPIVDSNNRFSINYLSCRLENPQITPQEARDKFINYAAQFRVNLQLENKVLGMVKEEEVLLGEIPVMTPQHSFIINGIERTVVSQLVRAQGVRFFSEPRGKVLTFGAQVIPQKGKGIWIVFESDTSNRVFVRVDQGKQKNAAVPVYPRVRAGNERGGDAAV